jgi:hypothetical protein
LRAPLPAALLGTNRLPLVRRGVEGRSGLIHNFVDLALTPLLEGVSLYALWRAGRFWCSHAVFSVSPVSENRPVMVSLTTLQLDTNSVHSVEVCGVFSCVLGIMPRAASSTWLPEDVRLAPRLYSLIDLLIRNRVRQRSTAVSTELCARRIQASAGLAGRR